MASPTNENEITIIQTSSSCNTLASTSDKSNNPGTSFASKPKIGRNGLERYFHEFKEYLTGEHKGKTSAVCSLCKEMVWHTKNVTSNYGRHLQRKHKGEFEEWTDAVKAKSNASDQLKQPTLQEAISSPRSSTYASSHPRQLELTEMVFQNFIVELGSPFSIVENPAFIRAMAIVDSKFRVPSRRMFTEMYLPPVYDKLTKKLKNICSSTDFLSLSLDVWTDRRMRAFYAVTMHFINQLGGLRSHLLAFNPLSGTF